MNSQIDSVLWLNRLALPGNLNIAWAATAGANLHLCTTGSSSVHTSTVLLFQNLFVSYSIDHKRYAKQLRGKINFQSWGVAGNLWCCWYRKPTLTKSYVCPEFDHTTLNDPVSVTFNYRNFEVHIHHLTG